MIYLLSFIIVIGLPVFLHELGHFMAARSVGIKVEKFYVGFNLFGLGYKKNYSNNEIMNIIVALRDIDVLFKTSSINNQIVIDSLLVKICKGYYDK